MALALIALGFIGLRLTALALKTLINLSLAYKFF